LPLLLSSTLVNKNNVIPTAVTERALSGPIHARVNGQSA
jgi:hypothetical protein